jgi:archaellum biogenesis ATPase FlaH
MSNSELLDLKRRAGMRPVEDHTGKQLAYGELCCCPLHEDHDPSFGPYAGPDGLPHWHCFGCAWEGDVINFVEKKDGLSTRNAILRLKEQYSNAEPPELPAKPSTPIQQPWKWTAEKVEKAAQALQRDIEALEFLESRGISPEQALSAKVGLLPAYKNYPARIVLPTFVDGDVAAIHLRAFGTFEDRDKWRKLRRDEKTYHLFSRDAAREAASSGADLYVVESQLDCVMLKGIGLLAVSVDTANHVLTVADTALLEACRRVILAGDTDKPGQDCAKRIEDKLPEKNYLRIVPQGVKDLGEMRDESPDTFTKRLAKLVRYSATMRDDFTFVDLLTESEFIEDEGCDQKYLVDKLIPEQRITMIYATEKSCKSLLAFYIGKCVCNNRKVFDSFTVKQRPAVYIDAEDGLLNVYVAWMRNLGREQVRLFKLNRKIPALDSPALLEMCRKERPLLIVDSFHKFIGREAAKVNVWRSSDTEPLLEKLRQLCVAGATIILIHHSTKSDPEQYRDTSVIGANVDFIIAVVAAEPVNGVKRIRMVGQPSRGGHPQNLDLIAFPALIELGKFTLENDPPKSDLERVVEFVTGMPDGCTKRQIRDGLKGIGSTKKDAALKEAEKQGRLVCNKDNIYSVPRGQAREMLDFTVPEARHDAGTMLEQESY